MQGWGQGILLGLDLSSPQPWALYRRCCTGGLNSKGLPEGLLSLVCSQEPRPSCSSPASGPGRAQARAVACACSCAQRLPGEEAMPIAKSCQPQKSTKSGWRAPPRAPRGGSAVPSCRGASPGSGHPGEPSPLAPGQPGWPRSPRWPVLRSSEPAHAHALPGAYAGWTAGDSWGPPLPTPAPGALRVEWDQGLRRCSGASCPGLASPRDLPLSPHRPR